MGEIVRVDRRQELTERQQAFVDALLAGAEVRDAMTLAGYADSVNTASVMGSVPVQKAIGLACDAQLRGPLRAKALQTLEELLAATVPAATRLQAAKFIMEQRRPGEGEDKPLSEMTEAELLGVIEKANKAVSDARQPGIIDVTPSNGA